MVPLGASALEMPVTSVLMFPSAVPAMRKRRLGYVWAITDEKYRSPIGKRCAIEW